MKIPTGFSRLQRYLDTKTDSSPLKSRGSKQTIVSFWVSGRFSCFFAVCFLENVHPGSLTCRPGKMMLRRRILSFWDVIFSGVMLNFQGYIATFLYQATSLPSTSLSAAVLRSLASNRWCLPPAGVTDISWKSIEKLLKSLTTNMMFILIYNIWIFFICL